MTSSVRHASMALLIAASGCASVDQAPPVPLDTDLGPTTACAAQIGVPQLVSTRAADLSPAIWQHKGAWEAQMDFALDPSGVPRAVRASVPGIADRATFEQAAVATLEGYRFCPPGTTAMQTEWSARMSFFAITALKVYGAERTIVQEFVPGYSRADMSSRRRGTNSVEATFGQDGRPVAVRLKASSNDPVLDRKSLEALASWHLVFAPGTVLTAPVVMGKTYTYDIR